MKASYSCGTCGKDETISGVEMPQIELWHELVSCVHTDEQIEHAVNANFGYYPAGDVEESDDVEDADARQDSADEAGNG